jgi:tol-pal system protein YbgF
MLLLLLACVLDRTGQSASEAMRREVALHGARLSNVEAELQEAERRVAQLEELQRDRGQQEIQKMETVDELRSEVARLRGDVETLLHDSTASGQSVSKLLEDTEFRVAWLETRAAQLEKSLGVKPPPPPERPDQGSGSGSGAVAEGSGSGSGADVASADAGVTDPDAMMKLAEEHLAGGREKAAEAVLQRFIKDNPQSPKLAEAKYRFAEAAFNAKDYKAAVLRFQDVIDAHKSSVWASWAMLRQGECFEVQGQKENAKLFYEDVMRLWPKSSAAKEAKQKLGNK